MKDPSKITSSNNNNPHHCVLDEKDPPSMRSPMMVLWNNNPYSYYQSLSSFCNIPNKHVPRVSIGSSCTDVEEGEKGEEYNKCHDNDCSNRNESKTVVTNGVGNHTGNDIQGHEQHVHPHPPTTTSYSTTSNPTISNTTISTNSRNRKAMQHIAWLKRFEELKQFQMQHGHCNVPQKYPENPRYVRCMMH
jgi:hypothetical protein